MQLYIKEARAGYIEVVDVEYPEFLFVLDGIEFREAGGELETVVEKMSVLRSHKTDSLLDGDELDEFLEKHSQKILVELFDSLLNNT